MPKPNPDLQKQRSSKEGTAIRKDISAADLQLKKTKKGR